MSTTTRGTLAAQARMMALAIFIAAYGMLSRFFPPVSLGVVAEGGAAVVERSFDAQILCLAADLIEERGWCVHSEIQYPAGGETLREYDIVSEGYGEALNGNVEGLCLAGACRAAARLITGEMPDACRFPAARAVALRVAEDPVAVTEDNADAVIGFHNDRVLVDMPAPRARDEANREVREWQDHADFLEAGQAAACKLLRSVADACDTRGRP